MSRRRVITLMMGNAGLRLDYQGLLRVGIERRCVEAGVDLWVFAGRSDWRPCGTTQSNVYSLVAPDRIDGIILASGCIASFMELGALQQMLSRRCPVPLCSVGHRMHGVANIIIDNHTGAAQVTTHLVRDHGCRKLLFVAGRDGHEESDQRLAAVRDAALRCGVELPGDAVVHGNFSRESARSLLAPRFARGERWDAIIAANDDMAIGALDAAVAAGLRCPADLAIAGFDDSPLSRVSTPSLTTVRQPVLQMGANAAQAIFDAWEQAPRESELTLHTEAVFRESCGCEPLRVAPPPRLGGASDSQLGDPRAELSHALASVVGDDRLREAWTRRLWDALLAEQRGQAGLLTGALERLLDEAARPDVELDDLQRIISLLQQAHERMSPDRDLGRVFYKTLLQVSSRMQRLEARRRLRDGHLMEELRVSWERLAASLDFNSLREMLVRELPRFSVNNAIICIHPAGETETLLPLACLVDGQSVELPPVPFPAEQLRPDSVPLAAGRCSYTVLPITFEWELLGVAMLELPIDQEAYAALREQIGSAVKTVRLHERLMHQQEKLKIQAELESQAAAERLRSMSLVAGGVAHDLNNALGPLVALPEAIRRDLAARSLALPVEITGDLQTLQEAAERAAHTIRDLLTLGRAVDVPQSNLELNRVLDRERRALHQLTERATGVTLEFELSRLPLVVHASKEHLLRAVSNLVANAADAMAEPGRIVVRTSQAHLERPVVGIERVEPGRYAVIKVQDEGCGIAEEHLTRVLEPFFTSKRQTASGGTGLGLAIVHQVVKQCRGYVHVDSQLGAGTTFSLFLPLVTQGDVAMSIPPASLRPGSGHVLVVDDERVQRRTARRILEQLGYQVTTSSSGEDALALFTEARPPKGFDLVMLDMLMPGALDGLSTLARLRAHEPGQNALIVSGYAPEKASQQLAEHRVQWLAKPYTAAALASAVRRALASPRLECTDPRLC